MIEPAFKRRVRFVLRGIEKLLLEKNEAYGNSALAPVGIFSRGHPIDLLAARMDDKLTRIQNMGGLRGALLSGEGEDAVEDLMGYLVLVRITACLQLGGKFHEDYESRDGSDN